MKTARQVPYHQSSWHPWGDCERKGERYQTSREKPPCETVEVLGFPGAWTQHGASNQISFCSTCRTVILTGRCHHRGTVFQHLPRFQIPCQSSIILYHWNVHLPSHPRQKDRRKVSTCWHLLGTCFASLVRFRGLAPRTIITAVLCYSCRWSGHQQYCFLVYWLYHQPRVLLFGQTLQYTRGLLRARGSLGLPRIPVTTTTND